MGGYFSGHVVLKIIRLLHKFNPKTLSLPKEIQSLEKNVETITELQLQHENNSNKQTDFQDVRRTVHIPVSIEMTSHNVLSKTSENPTFVAKAENYRYNITRAAAKRMVIFIVAYLAVNIGASLWCIYSLMKDKPLSLHSSVSDFVQAFVGTALFLVFKIVK